MQACGHVKRRVLLWSFGECDEGAREAEHLALAACWRSCSRARMSSSAAWASARFKACSRCSAILPLFAAASSSLQPQLQSATAASHDLHIMTYMLHCGQKWLHT